MGDKTQLTVLLLVSRTGRAVPVFLGATLGLVTMSALGAGIGLTAAELVSRVWIARVTGLLFVALGALMLWATIRREADDREAGRGSRFWHLVGAGRPGAVMAGSYGLLFLAEMGDKSQLAIIGLTGQSGDAWSVLLGASAALTLLTLIAATAGKVVIQYVPTRWISGIAGAIFILIGVFSLLGISW